MPAQTHEIKRSNRRKIGLATFFRELEDKPELLERFSAGRAGRAEVIGRFNLSPRHKHLLLEGSGPALAAELSGGRKAPEMSTVVIDIPFLTPARSAAASRARAASHTGCGHPDCEAFVAAARPV